ncbi:hypothetical protein KIN20_027000 [Parelaphostrongylus tenuis]|uniref:RING-type domain-containing protein n=1 Tax=Parelaphostrongylus tenuis TaxID=148309 RepID=A0AAD5QYR7_PARTN|nr:hypothetical protein KIN20_027000 [Parelaphostrongylus tenuis]
MVTLEIELDEQLKSEEMSDILRQVFSRLASRFSRNKYPVPHIEGADNVMVDSSVLCCPVCYNIFDSAPSVLQCGHTFCVKCLRNIANLRTIARQSDGKSFPCPLCRKVCCLENVVKNYIIEDILNRMEMLPDEAEYREKLALSNTRIAKERIEQKCADLELSNNRLIAEITDRKKKEIRNYVSIVFLFVSYLLLAHLYSQMELHCTTVCTPFSYIKDALLRGAMKVYQHGCLFISHLFSRIY